MKRQSTESSSITSTASLGHSFSSSFRRAVSTVASLGSATKEADDQDISKKALRQSKQGQIVLIDPLETDQFPPELIDPPINSRPILVIVDSYQKHCSPERSTRFSRIFRTNPKMASYPPNIPPGAVPPPNPGAVPPGAAVPESYFTESRKGEVNELRNLLRNFGTERDPLRKREIIKKVIAYMTLGIDVSRLFTDMMLVIETRDLVIKKMVYLFLCNYATTHPDLAQMCTNSLVKDCGNDDPMVRGLALRSLCSLRLPQMVEYISEPLRRSLTDGHAYVRKTGVMGILKLYYLDAEAFERCNFVDILYDMLRDPDASVVSNCIIVLNEIMPNGMAINRAIMLHLLNRIHEFSEFGVIEVLELIPRYIPANDDEGFQIMNLLDPVLRTSNSGAVLATIRAFLSIAGKDDTLKRQVVTRIKSPFVTLVSSGSSELVHCLLQNVEALVDLCPGIFDDEYRQFYIKYSVSSICVSSVNRSQCPYEWHLTQFLGTNSCQVSQNRDTPKVGQSR